MRVVTPFRPFEAESEEHKALGAFDWVGAIAMLRDSVARACQCETAAITDVDTDLPGLTFQYPTRERRLMCWILEVSLCYLAGPHFDRDTVLCSPDALVYRDLRPWLAMGDIGIVVRPEHTVRPILNALQWWPLRSRERLIAFYVEALRIAKTLPEPLATWGADTEPLRQLIAPIATGCDQRGPLLVHQIDSRVVMQPLSSDVMAALERGEAVRATRPVVDFRYTRKLWQRAFYDATLGAQVTA